MAECKVESTDLVRDADQLTPLIDDPPQATTPPAKGDKKSTQEGDDEGGNRKGRGKKRNRRAKGKKRKKQKSGLLINEDQAESAPKPKMQSSVIQLRPTHNPLINAPKNSTQFIIDDHEDSHMFWNFSGPQHPDRSHGHQGPAGYEMDGTGFHGDDFDYGEDESMTRYSPDDDNFWTAYSEKDFESVYETAHQEEVYSWEREKIIREINAMELKHKELVGMLAAIDPDVYLQKLQDELLSLQEVNRQLKLTNIGERLRRVERLEYESKRRAASKDRRSRNRAVQRSKPTSVGGCSSGCCLARPCEEQLEREQLINEVEQEELKDSSEQHDPQQISKEAPKEMAASSSQDDDDDEPAPANGAESAKQVPNVDDNDKGTDKGGSSAIDEPVVKAIAVADDKMASDPPTDDGEETARSSSECPPVDVASESIIKTD